MRIKYTVHSVKAEPVQVTAMVQKRSISAHVPGVTLELVGENGQGHTFRLVPEENELAQVLEDFQRGRAVTVEITADKE